MGATNFAFYNVERAYEFCMPYGVLDENNEILDGREIPDYLEEMETLNESLLSYLKELGLKYYPEKSKTYYDSDRNYAALKLGEFVTGFTYFGYDMDLEVVLLARCGYHEGMCLDFVCKWEGNDIYDQDKGYIDFDLEIFLQPQDIKRVKRNFLNRLEKEGNKIKTLINKMYEKHTS